MANTTFTGPVRSQNGFQSITINDTTGAVTVDATFGTAVVGATQSLSGAGAVNLTSLLTSLTTSGVSQALTLADGSVGQLKVITHTVDGGSAVLTPTTKIGFSTVTFAAVGDTVTLVYTSAGWAIVGSRGVTIA
jgi:hypothetical protein